MMRRLIQAALLLALSACGSWAESNAQPTDTSKRPFTITEVAKFDLPWAMEFVPGTSNALITEKGGRLWLLNLVNGQRQEVAGVPSVKAAGQGGLGDVVVHPQFAHNRRVYLSFAEAGADGISGAALGYGVLVTGGGAPRIDGFKVIWRQQPKVVGDGHFSHRIAFAPDGSMFVSSGDRQKFDPAQDMSGNLGKILRLTDEGAPWPANPWASRGGLAASFWSIGHRNVLGLAFAPDGRLWATEMGPKGGDELNLILPGRNYGWPLASYGSHYDGRDIPDDHRGRGFAEPKLWWNPSISPANLLIYTGRLFPQWRGDALFGGLSGQVLVRADINGDTARKADSWAMGFRVRAVEQGPRGEVYLLEDGPSGRLLRLEPAAAR